MSSRQLADAGLRHHQAGRLDQAKTDYLQALAIDPDDANALHLLGVLRHQQGDASAAAELLAKAIASNPNYPAAHNNLGNALRDLGRLAEAEACYREALRLRPEFPEAHSNLGDTLRDLDRLAEAEAHCREALRLRPDFAEAYNNLGAVLKDFGHLAPAELCFREALRLRPEFARAHSNLGNVLRALGHLAASEAHCREALRLQPNSADGHVKLAHTLLLAGRFEEGWQEYEWRWQTAQLAPDARNFAVPSWNGEAIGGRRILLHAEQGLGDTLQFCRYAPLVAAGARVFLAVQAPLVRLFSKLPGGIEIVAPGEGLPHFDLHCPLLSLPRAFGTTLATIPGAPYLQADPALAAQWRERLAGLAGLRVGLVWAGGAFRPVGIAMDRRRSIGLAAMAPFADVPAVSFVSLQKGEPSAQADAPPAGMALHDFTADLHDFADTAALIDGLDLVIGVDTAVAHLAGALGKPVWLLNRFDPDWRWLLQRDDSAWYPSLRQFRQDAPGEWDAVIVRVRDALRRVAGGDRGQLRPPGAVR